MFRADDVLRRRNGTPRPHVVVLEGASGSGKHDIVARLQKQGFCVVQAPHFLHVVAPLVAQHVVAGAAAALSVDEWLDAEASFESLYYAALKQACSKDVFRSRGKVIFVAHHPSLASLASAHCNALLASVGDNDAQRRTAALAQIEHDRRDFNMSLVRVQTSDEICEQRLQARLFGAQSSPNAVRHEAVCLKFTNRF